MGKEIGKGCCFNAITQRSIIINATLIEVILGTFFLTKHSLTHSIQCYGGVYGYSILFKIKIKKKNGSI